MTSRFTAVFAGNAGAVRLLERTDDDEALPVSWSRE
jgi:hypothetical protein